MIRNLRTSEGGFTIMELIVVLTVAVAITASALAVFNGRIPRTRFESSVNDLASKIESTMSEISSGYYPNTGVDCSVGSSGRVQISSGSTEQGENSECIFIGSLVKFGRDTGSQGSSCSPSSTGNCDVVRFYTLVGARADSSGEPYENINDANPGINEALSQDYIIPYGTFITKVEVGGDEDSVVGLAKTFGTSLSSNGDLEGASTLELLKLTTTTTLGNNDSNFETVFTNAGGPGGSKFASINPSQGVLVCLASPGTNQFATIEFGRSGATGAVERFIQEGSPAAGC